MNKDEKYNAGKKIWTKGTEGLQMRDKKISKFDDLAMETVRNEGWNAKYWKKKHIKRPRKCGKKFKWPNVGVIEVLHGG